MTSEGEIQALINSGLCGLIHRLNLSVREMSKNKLSVEKKLHQLPIYIGYP